MRILDWQTLDESERRRALARPELEKHREVARLAQEVVEAVRAFGDQALRVFTRRFDGVEHSGLAVSEAEFAQARSALTEAQIAALERAIDNVRAFHAAQLPERLAVETEPGVRCEQLIRPIGAVGLYVPAGSAPLPSAVIMLAVPAAVAGCPTRILCTPPGPNGRAHPSILVAAELCGIEQVFKVGGAQAIAAMAFGTESVPKVDKIFGPGNAWVTAAKQRVAQDPLGAVFDLPAGPSEVMVIADETARVDFVAADLLAQAEHDGLSQAILVTTSGGHAARVAQSLSSEYQKLSRRVILERSLEACRCILVPDLTTACTVANLYAPEHLILEIEEPRRWLKEIRNAGAVFLGAWSPEPMGDYCTGANHVLPTYGYARAASGLTLRDFTKTISVQELSREGLLALGPTAVALAELEGLDGHARAVNLRLAALNAAQAKEKQWAPSGAGAPQGLA